MARRIVQTTLVILAVSGIVGLGSFRRLIPHRTGNPSGVFVVQETSAAAVQEAFERSASFLKPANGRVRAGILPHHTLVAPLLAAFFSGIAEQTPPETVVILGPDHGNLGRDYVTTTKHSWQMPDGTLAVNSELVDALVSAGLASVDDQVLRGEHGVFAVLPYLKRVFPDAKIVQLAIRADLRPDKLRLLAIELRNRLEPNDLVVASVDFSHYKDATGAWTDDAVSLPVIRKIDVEAAFGIPVDSPPAIYLLLQYARLQDLKYQELVHMNSAEFLHDLTLPSATSYLTAYFRDPE